MRTGLIAAMLFLAAALSACDESEQGRVLLYEKGTYLGETDQPLSEETKEELRSRAKRQGGV